MDNIRILIVDDHPMWREALIAAFAEEPDMQVVGEAANGIDGLNLAEQLKPDVILMDLLMPGMDGLEAIERLFSANPQVRADQPGG